MDKLFAAVFIALALGCGTDVSDTNPGSQAMGGAPSVTEGEATPAGEAPLPDVDPNVADANITMGNMTVDGLVLTNLRCAAPSAGLFGAVTVVAGITARNAELKGCLGEGENVVVRWTQTGSSIETVVASSESTATARCVMDALRGAPASSAAECGAVLSEEGA